MSTVKSRISCGSKVRPKDELLKENLKSDNAACRHCTHAETARQTMLWRVSHFGFDKTYSLSWESIILSTSFSAWLSTFLPLAFCCLLPLGAGVLLLDLDLLLADLSC